MSLGHGWGWHPPQTAFPILFRCLQSVWTYWYAVHRHTVAALQSYPPYLARILGSLDHCWGWQPPQTASRIYISHIQIVWAHWYAVHIHNVAALHRYPPYLAQILEFWITHGVKMMSLGHCWGWQPPQTASCIYIRHIQSVTPPPWWWSRSPLQRHGFDESTPPEGRAALRIHFPRLLLRGLDKFNKLM